MAELSFVRQLGNSAAIVYIDQLPDRIFIDANKVRGVYSAKIVTRRTDSNVQPGGPDVLIKSATGGNSYITREALMQNFTLASGKKIKMAYLKNNKPYAVYGECSDSFKIFKLPDNCKGVMNGKDIAPGVYIVAKADASGAVLKDTLTVVSPAMFRKMFKIPMQDIIKRHMNGKSNRTMGSSIFNRQSGNMHRNSLGAQPIRIGAKVSSKPVEMPASLPNIGAMLQKTSQVSMQKMPQIAIQKTPQINIQKPVNSGFNRSGFGIPTQNKPFDRSGFGIQRPNQQESTQQMASSQYPFSVTHRIVNMNNHALIGFIVKEEKSGKTKHMSIDQVKMLCEKHAIGNLMLVTKEGTNLKYLRGNGIRIESLPEVIE